MATVLTKALAREIEVTLDLDAHSRGRNIIVELEPNGIITFRFKGTQREYSATIPALLQHVIQATLEADRRRK